MMAMGRPNENPRSTGLDMKLQIEPSRAAPASTNATPVAMTSPEDRAARRTASGQTPILFV